MMMTDLEVEIPNIQNQLEQNEEYFILKGENDEEILFHDYKRIFRTPGLYEEVFQNQLKCQSPKVIKNLLYDNVEQSDSDISELKVLDFGAGNGLVAEALCEENPDLIIGVDIIEEAKEAALRDRSECYEAYYVEDLGQPDQRVIRELESYGLNTFVSVAALGFDHIPPESFINAFNLIDDQGWIAINLRDRFLTREDKSGFRETLNWMEDNFIEFQDQKTYVHRLSVTGEPINYTAIVGRKVSDIE